EILSFISRVEERTTRATDMNDTSSRTHCVVHIRLWRFNKNTGKIRASTFNFLDLAGAERIAEAHKEIKKIMEAPIAERKNLYDGMMNNYTLHIMGDVVDSILARMKRGKATDHRSQSFRWCALTRMLAGTLCPERAAITSMLVTVSQAPFNSQPTKDALIFGGKIARIRMQAKPHKAVKRAVFVREIKQRLATSLSTLSR
ncbi:kinesin-like protein KIFC3, partial [Kipferlia bialata]